MNLIYSYDSQIIDIKSTSGKYLVSISERANVKYSSLTNDMRNGIRNVFNKLCFDNGSKELFVTLSEHIYPEWIRIKLQNNSKEYMLQITDFNSKDHMSIEEVAALLS